VIKANFVALGDVADVNWGDTSVTKASYVQTGYPAFSATGCDGFLPYADHDRDAIVLSAIGARCGKTWFTRGKWSCIKNTIRFWSTSEAVDNRYLYWATGDENIWPKRGAAQPFITIGDARRLKIPLPPFSEQRRIASILDQADALRGSRRETLAQLDSLTQSIFIEMFGDPIVNPKGWKIKSLGEVSDFYAGNSLPEGDAFTGQQGGYLLMRVSDMNLPGNEKTIGKCQYWSAVGGARSATCPAGSIIIPKRGGAIGTNKKRLTRQPTVLDPNLMAISPKPTMVQEAYLYQWFLGFDLSSISSGSSVPQLNKQDLAPLKIQVPDISLQKKFAARMDSLKALKNTTINSLTEFDALFASLKHRAFRGEL
jgi:type I restriction enzyme, S subunit